MPMPPRPDNGIEPGRWVRILTGDRAGSRARVLEVESKRVLVRMNTFENAERWLSVDEVRLTMVRPRLV